MFLRWIHKIETSSLCNRSCSYCPNSDLGYEKGNMTMETFERVLYWTALLNPQGQPNGERWLHLHGIGEPLLNPDIVEMVAKANEIRPTGFSTNGDALTEDLLKELVAAHVAYICISAHDAEVAEAGEALLKKYAFVHGLPPRPDVPWYMIQKKFNDNWAGQVDRENTSHKYHCSHLQSGGAMILWDGRIVTCCVDAQADPVLGSVYDDEIWQIDLAPIPLCADCRNNFYWKWSLLQTFHPTLRMKEKEECFRKWLNRG